MHFFLFDVKLWLRLALVQYVAEWGFCQHRFECRVRLHRRFFGKKLVAV